MEISDIIFIGAMAVVVISKLFGSKSTKTDTPQQDVIEQDTPITSSEELSIEQEVKPAAKPVFTEGAAQIKAVNTPKTSKNSPKIASKEQTDEEFDLRKAVIYSEILTPKFKDEDF